MAIAALHTPHGVAQAGGDKLQFQRLSVENGLSHPRVNCLHQDRIGYMWFGTEDGLNRFDGHEILVFRPDALESGANYVVSSIYEDADGYLWLGETDTEFSKFDPATRKFLEHHRYEPGNPESLPYKTHMTIRGAPGGTLWIGTAWRGLLRFDPRSGKFTQFPHRQPTEENSGQGAVGPIYSSEPGSDIVWLGTRSSGLIRLDSNAGVLHRFLDDPPGTHAVTPPKMVYTIGEETPGILWVGGDEAQLYRFDVKTGRFLGAHRFDNGVDTGPPEPGLIVGAVRDREGRIWVASQNAGLAEFRPDIGFFNRHRYDALDPQSLSHNVLNQVYRDRGGVIWVATKNNGVSFSDPAGSWIQHHQLLDSSGRYSNPTNVQCFHLEDRNPDVVWLGSGAGLTRWSRTSNNFKYYRHPPGTGSAQGSNAITCFSARREGGFWIGSQGGLSRYDPTADQMVRVEWPPDVAGGIDDPSRGRIRAVHEDRRGELWIGHLDAPSGTAGLLRFNPESGEVQAYRHDPTDPHSIGPGQVTRIHEDRQGRLWFASHLGGVGISRFDRQTGQFVRYRHDPGDPDSLRDDAVRAFHEDGEQDILWIGTRSGLDQIPIGPEANLRQFEHISPGASNDQIFGIKQDDSGKLWLACKTGLRLMPAQNQNGDLASAIVAPETATRFQELNDTFYKLRSGEILMGSRTGFFEIRPDRFQPGTPPPVVITDVQLRDGAETTPIRENPGSEKIVVPHEQNKVLNFRFAALEFSDPKRHRYAYRLEGLEEDWHYDSKGHSATYTTLPTGDYVFHVKAANSRGVWNEEGASLAITVLPPWWATWWLRGGAIVFFSAGIFGVARMRGRARRSRILELENEAEKREALTRQLSASDQRFQGFIANSSEQIWCVEFDEPIPLDLPEMEQVERILDQGHYVGVNEAFARAYGVTVEEATGWRLEKTLPRSLPSTVPLLQGIVRSGYRMEDMESVEVAADGSERIMLNNFIPTIVDGRVERIWGTARDVTEQKKIEAALQQQRSELSHVARVATMGELTAAFAHELNQPLAAILRNAQAAERLLGAGEPDLVEIREIMRDVVSDDRRAGSVLSKIRNLVSPEDRDSEWVDLNELVVETLDLIRSELLLRHQSVDTALAPDLCPVFVDRVQLQQVLINLIINAGDAMADLPNAEREATIRTGNVDRRTVGITVEDRGTGIPEEMLGRIFDPFVSTKSSGMGMGLAISRSIIESHGGRLWAENRESGGARIGFDLPIGKEE